MREEFKKYCNNICLNQACPIKIENEDIGEDCLKCELDWYKNELLKSRDIIKMKEKVNELNEKLFENQLQEKDKVIEELQEKLKPPVYHDVEKYYE